VTWSSYENKDFNFVLEHPPDWEALEDVLGVAVMVRGPAPADDEFRPNFTVMVEALEAPATLDDFLRAQLQNQARLLTDFYLLDVTDSEVAAIPAKKVLFTHRQGIFSLSVDQWWAIAPGGIIVLSGTAESMQYGIATDDFLRMAASFQPADV